VALEGPRYHATASQSYRDYDSYSDGHGATIANSQFRDRQTRLGLGVRLSPTHSFELQYQYFQAEDVGIPGAGGVFPVAATVRYPATRRELASARWSWSPGRAVWRHSEVTLFSQDIERRTEVLPNSSNYVAASGTQPARLVRPQSIEPRADHRALGFRWGNDLVWGPHQLALGVEGWQKKLDSARLRVTHIDVLAPDSSVVQTMVSQTEDRPLPRGTYRPVGVYAADELELSRAWKLGLGARLDLTSVSNELTYRTYVPATDAVLWEETDDVDLSWQTQARLAWRVRPGWEAYGNVSRSFRSPGLEERYLYVDLGHTVRLGDPSLDSEHGLFVEVGVRHSAAWGFVSGQAFSNRIRGLVIEVPGQFEGRQALVKANAGEALLVGFESEAAVAVSSRLLVRADVAMVRGTDERDDVYLPAIAPLAAHLSVLGGSDEALWASAAMEAVADQDRVAPGERGTPGRVTFDVAAGYGGLAVGPTRHRLTIGVKNLTDRAYRDHLATSRGTELTAPGRSFYTNWAVEM